MNFLDGSLFPENQDKLVITAAPYGPEWIPSDFPEDIPVTMEAQISGNTLSCCLREYSSARLSNIPDPATPVAGGGLPDGTAAVGRPVSRRSAAGPRRNAACRRGA